MSGPTYTYTPTVPQGPNPFNDTQSPILNNFKAISELIAVNHVGFNVADNFGKHTSVTMQIQEDPNGQPNEIIMFTKVSTGDNPAEIYIRYPDNTTDSIVQISVPGTDPSTPSGTSGGTASQGWCLFPSGVLFRWGKYNTSGNNTSQFTYTSGPTYKTGTYLLNSAVSSTSAGCKINVGLQTNEQPTYFTSYLVAYTSSASTSVGFNYLNIGI